ncbi:hypothetical protein C8R45DRAFT_927009 [Mycena sanguinolenta]|nr:hypothetical protein C8R45DRAFT_927009 [Mycena sanguinolenta]
MCNAAALVLALVHQSVQPGWTTLHCISTHPPHTLPGRCLLLAAAERVERAECLRSTQQQPPHDTIRRRTRIWAEKRVGLHLDVVLAECIRIGDKASRSAAASSAFAPSTGRSGRAPGHVRGLVKWRWEAGKWGAHGGGNGEPEQRGVTDTGHIAESKEERKSRAMGKILERAKKGATKRECKGKGKRKRKGKKGHVAERTKGKILQGRRHAWVLRQDPAVWNARKVPGSVIAAKYDLGFFWGLGVDN